MRTNPSTIHASYNVATSLVLGTALVTRGGRRGRFVCLPERDGEQREGVVAGAGANLPYLLLGYCGCLPRLCFLHATAVGRGAQGGEG